MNAWIKAETIKIKNNPLLITSLVLTFIFMVYIVFDPFPYAELRIPGYFSSVFLLSLTILGIVPIIILGSFLSYQEHSWNTFQLLLNSYNRVQTFFYKTCYILIASFLLTTVTTLFSWVVHIFLGAPGQLFISQIIFQIVSVSLICFFWGELAFVVALLTKNVAFSIGALFLLNVLEPSLYLSFNENLLKYFIVFNQKGLLSHTFSNLIEGSYIIVPIGDYPSFLWSILYQAILISVILFVGYQYIKKCPINS
ncbi:ABC transporter permease [Salipaludibacillus sp. LMS25]|jgi:hypothetical protein|uniref:ABC transporter permease n=1 Tax=Salipaludibacillus sp. LMS25 TaxID=2924031 RepID=UPI0020D0EBCD|nr:ABC transporter permease [Salipaludibacillus sp. LMS25]UTR16905.1 ABC transporter permease [Salipaludibacillus sp. LMS25]